jgi:acetolactate synthase small subunit
MRIYSFLVLMGLVWQLQAQSSEESYQLESQFAIYFASNSAELDEEALATLEEMLEDCAVASMQFKLQAFTDDLGNQQDNERLAKGRAAAVQNYLLDYGFSSKEIKIEASKAMIPKEGQSLEEQRRLHRRVDVEFWVGEEVLVSKENILPQYGQGALLQDFWQQEATKATQNFSFDISQGAIINGKQGTVLQIAPNTFVYEDGTPVEGEIQFSLREAYDYQSMMLQNLSTTAQGRLLETAGMFFTEAKDAEGRVVKIQEGKEIQAILPLQTALDEGMQQFAAQELEDGTVDWVAMDRPIRTSQIDRSFSRKSIDVEFAVDKMEEIFKTLTELPFKKYKVPKALKEPKFRKRVPRLPRYYELDKPTYEKLYAKYPQYKSEEKRDYQKRIRGNYQKASKEYHKKRKYNRKKYYQYRQDSMAYQRAYASYQKDSLAFDVYEKEMRAIADQMLLELRGFDYQTYMNAWTDWLTMTENLEDAKDEILNHYEALQNDIAVLASTGNDLSDLEIALAKLSLPKFSRTESRTVKMIHRWSRFASDRMSKRFKAKQIEVYDRRTRTTQIVKRDWKVDAWLRSMQKRLELLHQRFPEEGYLRAYHLKQIGRLHEKIEKRCHFRVLQREGERLQALDRKNARKKIKEMLACKQAIKKLELLVLERRNALGILPTEELASRFAEDILNATASTETRTRKQINPMMPVVALGRLGGFNCDRFVPPEPTTDIEILVDNPNANTAIFVLSEGRFSVLRASLNKDRTAYIVRNVPKSSTIRVVGVEVLGVDVANVFVERDMPGKLRKIQPEFNKVSLDEAKGLMAGL